METIISNLLKNFDRGTLTRRELMQGLGMIAAAAAPAMSAQGQSSAIKGARIGTKSTIVSLHHKSPTGLVDHFAIGVESFNKAAATQELRQYGITPEEDIDAGFHIKDPEGMNVQIV